ncbi:MAG: hypothetical protein KJ904_03095 [Alphaproteobacteria bacterium]|nr:hypothetical protein [Alphaproteobacteria bacterium]MBU0797924.1 hypothetical protein [Alphaproteobacteria bacterium]MBU0886124.1 hypothetical protein [Alphaproteobacteria bacterium]
MNQDDSRHDTLLAMLNMPPGSRIVLFGAGSAGQHAYTVLSHHFQVIAFTDSDSGKHGTQVAGIPILPLDGIAGDSYDFIVITSMFQQEIMGVLTGQYGMARSRIRPAPKQLFKEGRTIPSSANLTPADFDAVFDVLDACKVRYFADHSFLLGLARTGDFIPWEIEVDLAIVGGDEAALEQAGLILANEFDFTTVHYNNDYELWSKSDINMLKSASQLFDAHRKILRGEHVYWCVGPILLKFPERYYREVEYMNFKGRKIPVPVDHESYLAEMYGDWRTPNEHWSYTDYGNIETIFPSGFVK